MARVPGRAARDQLLRRLARDAGGVARARPLQPVLPPAGRRRARRRRSRRRARRSRATFKKAETYQDSKPTTQFKTEIPAFADTNALSQLLEQKGVVVNAEPLDTGAPWWQSLLLGFGPTILFVGLLFWLMRRAGSVQNVLGAFGRSKARRYEPAGDQRHVRRRRRHRRGEGGADRGRRLPAQPEKYRRLGGRIPHGVLLVRPAGHRQDAARARGRRRGGRAVLLDVGVRVRRGDRRRRRRRACATCSRRRRRRRRRSSSSTSSTRSAARARRASPASAAATTSASRR